MLQSRSRRLLTRFLPEIAGAAAVLPPRLVLDGELVVWRHGRVDFPALQRRIHPSAKRARELTARTPASYVAFDVLQHVATDVRRLPYRDRRRLLTRLVGDAPPPWALCPSTARAAEAADWFDDYRAAAVEGLVVKGQDQPYRGRVRGWLKLRHRVAITAIVGGVLGSAGAPEALILGRTDRTGVLRIVGLTGALPGSRAPRWQAPSGQVAADTAWEHGWWRHRPLFLRTRADPAPEDVPCGGEA